jgi:plastocyanin
MKSRASWIAVFAAISAIAVPATAFGGAHVATSHTVVLKNLAFTPRTLSIHRGDSVTWKWEDGSVPHNVTSSQFHGASTRMHGSFTVRFTHSGTFNYRCTIHSFMKAKIVVH